MNEDSHLNLPERIHLDHDAFRAWMQTWDETSIAALMAVTEDALKGAEEFMGTEDV